MWHDRKMIKHCSRQGSRQSEWHFPMWPMWEHCRKRKGFENSRWKFTLLTFSPHSGTQPTNSMNRHLCHNQYPHSSNFWHVSIHTTVAAGWTVIVGWGFIRQVLLMACGRYSYWRLRWRQAKLVGVIAVYLVGWSTHAEAVVVCIV